MKDLSAAILQGNAFWQRVVKISVLFNSGVLVLLTLLVVVDVSMRYLFLKPIPGAAEMTELMLPYIAFCSFAYALVAGAHVRMTLVVNKISPPP